MGMIRPARGRAGRWLRAAAIGFWVAGLSACPAPQPRPLPRAQEDRFAVVVAQLEDDDDSERDGVGDTAAVILQGLQELHRENEAAAAASKSPERSFQIMQLDRVLSLPKAADPDESTERGHTQARQWLSEMRASILIWGRVLKHGGQRVPVLHITGSREQGGGSRYPVEQDLALSKALGRDLSDVLHLVVMAEYSELAGQEGIYVADRLKPFLTKVEALVGTGKFLEVFRSESRGDVRWTLGLAQMAYGRQKGDRDALEKAVQTFEKAEEDVPRSKEPIQWAQLRMNRANSLSDLGGWEADTKKLEDAVALYRQALIELPRERVPLHWAITQNNLGNALMMLGERQSETERLEEAVGAYRLALSEWTRERSPWHWAAAQNNLGIALQKLGERESGTKRLEEAVEAYRLALLERTRERVPLQWATTQNNLGNALRALGERESGTKRLEEAVEAFRLPLSELTRERVPLSWAAAQISLGIVLARLGERQSETERLEEAVGTYRLALSEFTRECSPWLWAAAQNNLGIALQKLGERESGTTRLEEAVGVFRLALSEWTRERSPWQWASTQNNLGDALETIGERRGDRAILCEALLSHLQGWRVFQEGGASHDAELATRGVRLDLAALQTPASKFKPIASTPKPACPQVPAALWKAFQAAHP